MGRRKEKKKGRKERRENKEKKWFPHYTEKSRDNIFFLCLSSILRQILTIAKWLPAVSETLVQSTTFLKGSNESSKIETHWLSSDLVAISKLLWLEGCNTPIVWAWNIFIYLDAKSRVNEIRESKEKQGLLLMKKKMNIMQAKRFFCWTMHRFLTRE